MSSAGHDLEALAAAVRRGERAALGQALTLVESRQRDDAGRAQKLLAVLLPHTGGAVRVGVSGPPGAGKSTLIEALGLLLAERGQRVAVMAIDPSSALSGGSILGDKTRMGRLARHERVFIRPSPSGGALGGVARRSREAQLVLEAAGFDVVLLETVGVGQSEAAVADLVDTFVLVLAPGAGDELQGIKRGVLELADVVVVAKADGDLEPAAERARRDFAAAMALVHPDRGGWRARVVATSAVTGKGVPELWALVEEHQAFLREKGSRDERRQAQRVRWMWELAEEGALAALRGSRRVAALAAKLEEEVRAGTTTPARAAHRLLTVFGSEDPGGGSAAGGR